MWHQKVFEQGSLTAPLIIYEFNAKNVWKCVILLEFLADAVIPQSDAVIPQSFIRFRSNECDFFQIYDGFYLNQNNYYIDQASISNRRLRKCDRIQI